MNANRSVFRVSLRWLAAAVFGFAVFGAADGANAQCLTPPGDINDDSETDVVDIQCAILVSLNELAGGGAGGLPSCLAVPTPAVDVNCDGETNVADLLVIISFGFQLPLGGILDPDADGCPDACEVPGSVYVAPVYVTGTAANGQFTLRPTGGGEPSHVPMTGGGFVLEPRAVGFED
jgi:hypothetical protein